MDKYKFWIELENGAGEVDVVEWTNLTERTAKMMYNATRKNCHYLYNPLHSFGWEKQ